MTVRPAGVEWLEWVCNPLPAFLPAAGSVPGGQATKQDGDSAGASSIDWIERGEIEAIPGALTPSAYVARAYKETMAAAGRPPVWARKLESGKWLFDARYIAADAREQVDCIGIEEASGLLGATRRAVQNWVDCGEIATTGGATRKRGERRRILRAQFMLDLPRLRKRLETPAVLGFKLKHGPVPAPAAPAAVPVPEQAPAARGPGIRARLSALTGGRRPAAGPAQGEHGMPAAGDTAAKTLAVASAEAQFKSASRARQQATEQEAAARKMAERLVGAVFGGEMNRIDAMIMFNQLATERGVPDPMRIAVRKEYFGK